MKQNTVINAGISGGKVTEAREPKDGLLTTTPMTKNNPVSLITPVITANIGLNVKTAEEIAKQKELASKAYSLLGIVAPVAKVRKSSTGRRYLLGFRELIENGSKVNINDLLACESHNIDNESMCRTLRAYIAYKIGHSLKEQEQANGSVLFYFGNRITKQNKSIEVVMSDSNAYEFVLSFYKDCMAEITDKWGIFQTANGSKYLLTVNGGKFHIVQVATIAVKSGATI